MKKITLLLVTALLLALLTGCHEHEYSKGWTADADGHFHAATCHDGERSGYAPHAFVAGDTVDGDGKPVYVCSTCGYEHQHIYDAEKWEYDGREHWHPIACGHSDAAIFTEEHTFADDSTGCSICGCSADIAGGYQVAFSYYQVDENGNPVVDSETGAYVQVGVTYTDVKREGSTSIDTLNGAVLYDGDKISFTVEKSVFCYYTDNADSPLVEVISGTGEGSNTVDTVYPDEDGVYTVEIKADTVISVANVETSPSTVSGKGTKEDPFTINSEVDWLYFAMYINESSLLDYNIGYWQLTADLDFEGESIYVIGDGFSSANAIFCGNFNGGGHTISNFVLENSVSSTLGEGYSNYLGLFGVVTGYVGVDSVIANLNVENVTVNATANNDDIVSAGCILGYGVGTNVLNCTVKNSTVNVSADDLYMSYAGGVVGYLQSGMTEDGILFYSSVGYSVAENVTIKGTGMLYGAGGIVGRLVSYSDQVTSFIINSYSSGSVSDSVRAGGIVGELQRYGSVQNCYSTASVSAYATYRSAVDAKFDGTAYDDRYAYAGGIVGYAENDTVVEGSFFDGSVYSTALAGNSFAKKGNIVAGASAERFADYYASAAVLNNQADDDKIDNDYLKDQFGWSEADWVFGEGYPTINKKEVSRTFTVKINAGGEDSYQITVDSQYIPLSYWYVIDGNGTLDEAIKRYYQNGAERTYGYFFDASLKKPVPVGYVPMKDMTLYTDYANTDSVAGEYYLSNGGVSAVITIFTDGSYTYEEGAILLRGSYNFDGQVVTFYNSFFSRMAAGATSAQRSSYYTFWAKLQENGDLHVFDCDEKYVITAENEAQNPSFTAMARFFEEGDPLIAVSSSNLSFTGGYYYTDGDVKHVFEFNNDYTGVYKKYNGASVITDTFSFVKEGQSLIIALDQNGTQFIAKTSEGLIEDNRGDSFNLSQIDGFAGVWEKEATSHKVYTFDGMGSWSYEHFVYLIDDNLVNATKKVVSESKGSYLLDGDSIIFTRDGIDVVATMENGVIFITENGLPVEVEFTGANGFKGVWYTANNKIVRYTLTLEGLNSQGIGEATLGGFEIEPLSLRYTAVSDDTLYLYVEDVIYAVLQYSPKSGLFNGLFYDTATGSATTPQTLYLYDDYAGSWVSDIEDFSRISFNGFGAYSTVDPSGNTLAVKGSVTIGKDTVNYTVDRTAENAKFTYKGVEYVLSYDEYTDTISVSYGANYGVIAKADVYADVILKSGDTVFEFDGRGNLAQGGTVKANGVEGVYKIQSNGDVLMTFDGAADQTINVIRENGDVIGYSLGGETLYVDNAFSGTWVIPGKSVSIEVGKIAYIPENGKFVEISGKFNGAQVTMYYDGAEVVSFTHDGKAYSLTNTLGGKPTALILAETITIGTSVTTEKIIVKQDDFFGAWIRVDKKNEASILQYRLTFDGAGASPYIFSGEVTLKQGIKLTSYVYKIGADGVLYLYEYVEQEVNGVKTLVKPENLNHPYAKFVECESSYGEAYQNGDRYYKLEII